MLKLSPTVERVSKKREGNLENQPLFSNISSGKRGKIEDSGLNFSQYK